MRRSLTTLLVLLVLGTFAATVSTAAEAASAGTSSRAKTASKRASAQARSALRVRLARRVTSYARRQLGTPYRWGGTSPGGFDCSGLVYAAYRSIGRSVPRTTWGQLRAGRRVSWRGLRPGDLLFTRRGGHVVLVVSRTAAISAPRTGRRVRFVPLSALRGSFYAARRVI
jgi:cell wall-associated NlpC family hydrolase